MSASKSSTEPNPLLRAALGYAAKGWAVFPCHGTLRHGDVWACTCREGVNCDSMGKHPRTGRGVKEATTDAEKLRAWWEQWPRANVAIATGAASNLLVIDVDPGGEWPQPEWVENVTTPRGRHFYYRYPSEPAGVTIGRDLWPAVDWRGEGGYVLAPPSLVKGQAYRWHPQQPGVGDPPAFVLDALTTPRGAPQSPEARPAPGNVPSPLVDDYATVASALERLSSDDYATWIEVGMALQDHFGEAGFALWDRWSASSSKYKANAMTRHWRSFDGGKGIGIGTIFARAKAAGWERPRETRADRGSSARGNGSRPGAGADSIDAGRFLSEQQNEPAYTLGALQSHPVDPVRWAIAGWFPEGVTLLAGDPKINKSWLALQACLSVGYGVPFLGAFETQGGEALYLALEDTEYRIASRVRLMLAAYDMQWPSTVSLKHRIAPASEGGIDWLDAWLEAHPDAQLLVIDTFDWFRDAIDNRRTNAYRADREAVGILGALAKRHRLAVVVIHHTNKGNAMSDDWMDGISGTKGLSGTADMIMRLKKPRGAIDAILHRVGRDTDSEEDFALKWVDDTHTWQYLGDAAEWLISKESEEVHAALAEAKEPLTMSELHELMPDVSRDALRMRLHRMRQAHQVVAMRRGRNFCYRSALISPSAVTPHGLSQQIQSFRPEKPLSHLCHTSLPGVTGCDTPHCHTSEPISPKENNNLQSTVTHNTDIGTSKSIKKGESRGSPESVVASLCLSCDIDPDAFLETVEDPDDLETFASDPELLERWWREHNPDGESDETTHTAPDWPDSPPPGE